MRWWSSNPAGISRAHINSFRSGGQGCAKTSCSPARTIRDRDWLDTVLELAGISAHASVDVFACEPEWAALTREIGGDKVSIHQATTALQDVHHIQARPSLLAHVRSADLIVCSGADLEVGWLPVLMQSGGNPKIRIGQPGLFHGVGLRAQAGGPDQRGPLDGRHPSFRQPARAYRPAQRIGRIGFYLLFGLSVTASVQLVGIYLVFATLIIPALATRHATRARLAKAYVVAALGYAIGLFLSAWLDLPSGAVVVWALAIAGIVAFAIERGEPAHA